jgi:hypothetical protein
MSEDFSGRDVVFRAIGGGGTIRVLDSTHGASAPGTVDGVTIDSSNYYTICNNGNSNEDVSSNDVWNVKTDTTGSFDADTGRYTIPETGYYDISAQYRLEHRKFDGTSDNDTTRAVIGIVRNIRTEFIAYSIQGDSTGNYNYGQLVPDISIQGVYIVKGDTLELACYQTNDSATTRRTGEAAGVQWFSVSKRQSAQTILENETVACTMKMTSSSSVVSNTGSSTCPFDKTDFDTHNGNDGTNKYTIPVTGIYSIQGQTGITGATGTYGLRLVKNGSSNVSIGEMEADNEGRCMPVVEALISLNKGDYLQLKVDPEDDEDGTYHISENSAYTWFSIHKIK